MADRLTELLQDSSNQEKAARAIKSDLGSRILRTAELTPEQALKLLENPQELRKPGMFEALTEGPSRSPVPPRMVVEAIIELSRRPVYLVQDNCVNGASGLDTFDVGVDTFDGVINPLVSSVGRVELRFSDYDWAGTAWLIEDDLVVTNRHVAELFAEADNRGGFRFRLAGPGIFTEAAIDFLEEHQRSAQRTVEVTKIEYMAPADGPDMALLRLARSAGSPIRLSKAAVQGKQMVGVVGYPANDPKRNSPGAIEKYFGAIFDKKRFAPGYVKTAARGGEQVFTHDCTTLGGNSGSVVLDLASGEAVGLHFAGSFRKQNFAVTSETLQRMRKGLRTIVSVPAAAAALETPDGRHTSDYFQDRQGYKSDHLGVEVALPDYSAIKDQLITPSGASVDGAVAHYQHFSLVMHQRRVPLFTAVNIDGGESRRIKRGKDKWFADQRYPEDAQLKREHFAHPDIDRGHMVRREDPNWGDKAQTANDDTFHYTNAAPQHSDLNQGKKAWQGLENYILDNARTDGFKASVFTGPVLRESDRVVETDGGPVQFPEEFWKVVVALDAETSQPRATAYLLGQGRLLDELEAVEARYGQYGTYQVTVASIEDATGLRFGDLRATDPLGGQEAPETRVRVLLGSPEQMIL